MSDLADDIIARRSDTAGLAVASLDDSPDDAARVVQLSRTTGMPAPIIGGDLEGFERQHRSDLATELLRNNPTLSDYVASNPMAAKLSNDDYGNLDEVSQATKKLGKRGMLGTAADWYKQGVMNVFSTSGEAFKGGYRWDEQTSEINKLLTSDAGIGIAKVPLIGPALLSAGIAFDTGMRTLTAATYAVAGGLAAGAENIGLTDPASGRTKERLVRDLIQGFEVATAGEGGFVRSSLGLREANQIARETQRFGKTIEPWVKEGREPPVGLEPFLDDIKAEQAKLDIDNLLDLTKVAGDSLTRERSPEMFRDFVSRDADGELGISADAVRAIYGDKPPAPDDGLLGFVPRLGEQLASAEAYGGDVMVPLADWLAHVDPTVAREIKDYIRVRKDGVTLAETKLEKVEKPSWGEPIDDIRVATALEPMLMAPERKLKLARMEQQKGPAFEGFHDFELLDEQGSPVGFVMLAEQNGGKQLYVEDISMTDVGRGEAGGTIGPRAVREILRQIKEEFPNAEELTGFRVSGARDKAGTWESHGRAKINLMAPEGWGTIDTSTEFARILEGGEWKPIAPGYNIYVKPRETYVGKEAELLAKIDAELERIAPQAGRLVGEKINLGAQGLHSMARLSRKAPSLISVALEASDPLRVAWHESIHHLRQRGLLSQDEWSTLEEASLRHNWQKSFDIRSRYEGKPEYDKVEESIAEAFQHWKAGKLEVDGASAKVFQKLKEIFDRIAYRVKEVFGADITWDEIFEAIDRGDVGRREEFSAKDAMAQQFSDRGRRMPKSFESRPPREKQLDFINEVTRMEDREVFDRAGAVGMTVVNYRRYMKLIEKLRSEDEARQLRLATAAEAKRQTAEWKQNRVAMRERVTEELAVRPDWQADKMIQDGLRLDADSLTDEQKAALPRRYYNQSDEAVSPNVLADLVGLPDGQSMIDSLINFVAPRVQAKMQPMEYTRRLIDIETDARMEQAYGDLQKNILEEAKEHVLSETQLDLLHEETLALAAQAGAQLPIPKDALVAQIKTSFEEGMAARVDSDVALAAAGRAGRAVEEAMLKGDFQEAFKQKQRQSHATIYAREAAKFEREMAKFEKLAGRYEKREGPKNVDRAYIDHIQSLLLQAGADIRRSPAELAEARGMSGFANLESFVEFNRDLGWEPAVTDAISAGQFKRFDDMTVEEFREMRDAVQSLDHIGKAVRKIEVAGKAVEFAEWKAEVIQNIVEHGAKRKDVARLSGFEKKIEQLRSGTFAYDAMIVRMEEVMKDLDGRKDAGPLFSALIRPLAESKHTEYSMLEDLTKRLRALQGGNKKWRKTLDDTIPHDFLIDPLNNMPFDLTRSHMINIMLNWGNEGNVKKFVQGYFGKTYAEWGRQKLENLFARHATKEDWDFVQNIWDIFKDWEPAIKKLYYDTSGVPPKLVDAREVVTPHGTYRGGYFPIIFDRLRSSIGVIQDRSPVTDKGTFARDYFRSTTGNGYTKARTGYVDYVEFATTLDQVGSRMQQIIHDVSYRRAVIDSTKIIYDRQVREAIRNNYGIEYEKQLNPWLKDIANHFNQNEDAVSTANNFFRRLRYNLMGHALGLNLKVLGSPDVGLFNPMAVARILSNYDESVALAWSKSKEIPHTFRNMDRDFRENLERIVADNKLDTWSANAQRFAFYPMVKFSQGFRIITFVEEYNKALARGLDEGAAAAHADSIVRERHGSAGLPDLPAAMRSSEAMKWSTLFYGYFSAMYNWQRQIPGQLRRGEFDEVAKTLYGAVGIGAVFGALLFNQTRESDSWYKNIAKALALQVSGTLWIAREAFNFLIEGFPSRTPFNNLVNSVGATVNDVRKAIKRRPVEKPIQHSANVIGLSTGLPLGQIGRTSQFVHDVQRGKQRPRNVMEWIRGIIHGEARLKP